MRHNFICCDRDQPFLLPPSIRDWLPADHLAWFVIDAVARMDLSAFYRAYRDDGHGRAAYGCRRADSGSRDFARNRWPLRGSLADAPG